MTEDTQKNNKKIKCFCGEIITVDSQTHTYYCKKCECSVVAGADLDIEFLIPGQGVE